MDTFAALGAGLIGRAAADEPLVRLCRRDARHRGRRAARHRPGAHRGAAAADHLQARPGGLAHHVRRHLLWRHVWRLHRLHPAQHAGRELLHRHGAGGQQDGPGRARRAGARHRRHRLLRRRLHRHRRARADRADRGRHRHLVRAGRLFRADGARLRHRLRRLRRLGDQGPHQPVHRPHPRPDRHRPAERAGAALLRHPGPARRRRGDDAGGGAVRHRRDALGRCGRCAAPRR